MLVEELDQNEKIARLKQIAFEIHGFVAANAEDHKPEKELPPPPSKPPHLLESKDADSI